jgi:hypothetical protein
VHAITGGPGNSVTCWAQLVVLPQQSRMIQAVDATKPQPFGPVFVWVPTCVTELLVPQHASTTPVGGSKVHAAVQRTVLSGAQITLGGVVSTMATDCVQALRAPPQSITCQPCSTLVKQGEAEAFVVVLMMVSV